MADRHFIPIQPRPGAAQAKDEDPTQSGHQKKLAPTLVACEPCRRSKTKCDGQRPSCGRCRAKNRHCTYEVIEEGISRSIAQKALMTTLKEEVVDLRDLFRHLCDRPEPEASELFQRLRRAEDPVSLIRSIREAELLLPDAEPLSDGVQYESMDQLEQTALGQSEIKVPARPWTNVAGDGIVSELVTSWFKWDDPFLYAFLDRDVFIQEMRLGDPTTATHCTPFLLNVICAKRSLFSDSVRSAARITHRNMAESFLSEGLRLYDHGVPTLPTTQGLWILFGIMTLKCQDKFGSIYRHAAYGMLKKMKLEESFAGSSLPGTGHVTKQAMSQTAWGIFCLESLMNPTFHSEVTISAPRLPCLFAEAPLEEQTTNQDILGRPFGASSPHPPITIGVSNTLCKLAVLMNRITTYSHYKTPRSDEGDLLKRQAFYAEVESFGHSLPVAMRHDYNFTPQTCFLGVFMDIMVYSIVRPLLPNLEFGTEEGLFVKDKILKHCSLTADVMEKYFSTWTTNEYSVMVILGPLNAGIVLLPLLPDKGAQSLFTRMCRLLYPIAFNIPVAKYILKGWEAALWSMNLDIPQTALPYFQNLGDGKNQMMHIPTNLLVAPIRQIRGSITEEDDGELGALLSAWGLSSED
ncbi:putative C6 transcription factor [Xylariaceae sp. FL0255]|nr:putative C6 transcription factor [Xylariaceae sp. FL0255]